MKSILISTSSLWNCGDDFIRNGVLNLLNLKPNVRTIWWNRAYGISSSYANDLKINIKHCNYVIIAGTPQWIDRHTYIFWYCLKNNIPMSLIGVGTKSNLYDPINRFLIKKIASSGLVECCMARDQIAFDFMRSIGFKNVKSILDPAFFSKRLLSKEKINVLGWRDYEITEIISIKSKIKHYGKYLIGKNNNDNKKFAYRYNVKMQELFNSIPDPKIVVVHDNREIEKAEILFGKNNVFYSSDYQEIYKIYSKTKSYIGSRIHGAIPSIIHGAAVNLFYRNDKIDVINNAEKILSRYIKDIDKHVHFSHIINPNSDFNPNLELKPFPINILSNAIQNEMKFINSELKISKILSDFIN